MPMNELEQEAAEIGRNRGWDHANFVEAYGGDPNESPEVPELFAEAESFFLSGWEEGVSNFAGGLYADGSRDEDGEGKDDLQAQKPDA